MRNMLIVNALDLKLMKRLKFLGSGETQFDKKWDKKTDFKLYSASEERASQVLTQPCNPQPQAINSFPEFTRFPAIYLVSV
jgi:hypothetical protein